MRTTSIIRRQKASEYKMAKRRYRQLNYPGAFTFSTFERRDMAICRQWFPTSCRELREAISGFLRMQNFSFVHRLHHPVTGLKGAPLSSTFHLTSKVEPLALSSQMWVLSLVSSFLFGTIYIMHFLHISQYMHQGWIGYRDYRPLGSIHSVFNQVVT